MSAQQSAPAPAPGPLPRTRPQIASPPPLEDVRAQSGESSLSRGFADLAERAVAGTPGCCAAALTLTDGESGALAVADGPSSAFTHPDLATLMALQLEQGEGPVPDALLTGEAVSVGDLLREPRWPHFRARALDCGLRSCVTLPYRHEGTVLTVTLFAFRPHRLLSAARHSAPALGELAAGVLGRDRNYRDALAEVRQLHAALRSRPVVDQACGIVMAAAGCTAEDAFGLLRTLSQRSNRKLSELAEAVVRNRGRGVAEQLRRVRRSA